jgi:(1->4)-alpha-D-glucan 1-alpha-D-glucosylmutase
VARLLDADPANPFLADFAPFAARVACLGAQNGLSQLLIKLTAPGVPDLYQGSELWELSMVDPDNRRPVDYAARAARLAELDRVLSAAAAARAAAIEGLLRGWADGSVKMLVTRALLALRQRRPALFRDGAYRPLSADGAASAALCAFARERDDEAVVVLAPRLCAALPRPDGRFPLGEPAWGDATLSVPSPAVAQRWRHVVTGEVAEPDARGRLPVRHLLGRFPVAALEPAP